VCVDYSQKQALDLRAVEIEAVSRPINVFLIQCSKCEMSDKRLMFAKSPKKVRNEPEDTLNMDGSQSYSYRGKRLSTFSNRTLPSGERWRNCQTASELNNEEEELRVDTETADDDAIKDDMRL